MSGTAASNTAIAARPRPRKAPWRDPQGRVSALKLATFVLVFIPGVLVIVNYATHQLGARPNTEAIHRIGDWAVRLVLISLAVSPARYVLNWPKVMLLRRMLGVAAAGYAGFHFVLYCADEQWQAGKIVSEIVLRFYLTIGFIALTALLVLAATSFDKVVRRMGRRWKALHRLVYPIAVLAIAHYFLQTKANVAEAVLFAGFFAWLMLWRTLPMRLRGRLWILPLLAVAAGLATAAIEGIWFAAATNVSVRRILMANLDVTYGPSPAVSVAIIGLLVFVMAAARRLFGRKRARAVVVAS